ncbi:MAG TPA: PepSY-associated TM helix domain-containing protein [Cyclobacteriaceae bacterium]
MKLTVRNTHRDIAYFFVGLIIAFAFSGIFLNHRQTFNPRRYTYDTREIQLTPFSKDEVDEAFIKDFTTSQKIEDELRRFQTTEKELTISYASNDVKIDMVTGTGMITTYRTIPLLGQMTKLHQDTSKWWIYYSDGFGIAMLIIAFTGMFIEKGKNSFRSRGFKLALIGIIFPLIFLFLLS